MTGPKIITFTTDFGTTDSFVGQMKGAALSVHRDLCLVDLCHEVPAQDVSAGAYLLETGYGAFPEGTVHVAVVDPGVGSARRAVAVAARRGRHRQSVRLLSRDRRQVGRDIGVFRHSISRCFQKNVSARRRTFRMPNAVDFQRGFVSTHFSESTGSVKKPSISRRISADASSIT